MWKFGQALNIGRRSEQQDRLALFSNKKGHRHLLVLADGMGGLEQGANAAQIVIDTAEQAFKRKPNSNPELFLEDIIHQAHRSINRLDYDSEQAPGTTCVLLFLNEAEAYWAHVGDSRLYLFRQGRLFKQTKDHSARQLLIDQGLIEADSNAADDLQNQLYKRLGGEQKPEPNFDFCELAPGDLFMLCSDGLWQSIDDQQVPELIEQHPLDNDGAGRLAELAFNGGGAYCDNISVILSQMVNKPKTRFWQKIGRTINR